MEGDLTWSGEHTIQYTDDVLQNCTPETQCYLPMSLQYIQLKKEKKTVLFERATIFITLLGFKFS